MLFDMSMENILIGRISELKLDLARAKEIEDRRNSLIEKREEVCSILKEIAEYLASAESGLNKALALQLDFREKRINFLEKEIEDNLYTLLPDEQFEVDIDFRTIADGSYADMYIGKKGKAKSLPKAKNGRFVRQLISLTVRYSVSKLSGCLELFCDEALSSADGESLKELKPLIDDLVKSGFQFILIEHKEELYKNLDRREIRIYKDRSKGKVIVMKEEDINART